MTDNQTPRTTSPPTMTIDVERFDYLLENSGLTAEQRRQTLQDLWVFVVAVVDFGFRVEPLESQRDNFNQTSEITGKNGDSALYSQHKSAFENYMNCAGSKRKSARKGV